MSGAGPEVRGVARPTGAGSGVMGVASGLIAWEKTRADRCVGLSYKATGVTRARMLPGQVALAGAGGRGRGSAWPGRMWRFVPATRRLFQVCPWSSYLTGAWKPDTEHPVVR